MSRKYLSCAETAALARQALKEAFQGFKFSVVSKTYSGGASMRVRWMDGPNEAQVKAVAGRFHGADFDGMQDLKTSFSSVMNGEEVRFGADYVFFERDYSDAAVEKAIDSVFMKYAGNFKRDGMGRPALAEFRSGKLWNAQLSGLHNYGNQSVQQEIFAALHKKSDRGVVAKSAVAASVEE